jgi:hypothetical protein
MMGGKKSRKATNWKDIDDYIFEGVRDSLGLSLVNWNRFLV